jgi:Ca2+-binding EF-hand superfamily protein
MEKDLAAVEAFIGRRLPPLFSALDANTDGKVTLVEAEMAADRLGPRGGGGRRGGFPQRPQTPRVSAEDQLRENVKRQFVALDKNKDDRLSDKEVAGNANLRTRFKQIDADLDGFLSFDEVFEVAKAQPAAKK